MNRDTATQLRAAFPAEKIGKLPRVTCGLCRDSRDRSCDKHTKAKCTECGAWITPAHIHLDFVGHADATDRFLEVDPDWTWEPFALDPRGLPAFDDNGGIWIRLTIAGTTRIGYGDADGKKGANAVKEAIGDALRNAGLRFGVALDLWRKEPPVDESRRQHDPKVADPTGDQLVMAAGFAAPIHAAATETALREIWDNVVMASEAGWITTEQRRALSEAAKRRKAELEASSDSTGDGDGGGAQPGPPSPGAGPDGEGAGVGGPGLGGETGGGGSGVQPRVHGRGRVDRGPQAHSDDRDTPAAVGS
jgi:hypothetical protein